MSKAKEAPKATETPEKEVNRNVPTSVANTVYIYGPAVYNPKAAHNIASWERMCKLLDKAGDKGVSGAVLAKELTVNGKHPAKTHFDFLGYLERNNQLAHKA